MFTAEQVKNLLENVYKEKPEKWVAAVQTIFVDFAQRLETLEKDHAVTRKGAVQLAKEAKEQRGFFAELKARLTAAAGGEAGEPAGEVAPSDAEPAPAPASTAGGVRVGADGTPLTPEQIAIEDAMDAATGAAPAAPAAPQPRRRGKAAPSTSNGSLPTDPEARQAAIEEQMNAAAGPAGK